MRLPDLVNTMGEKNEWRNGSLDDSNDEHTVIGPSRVNYQIYVTGLETQDLSTTIKLTGHDGAHVVNKAN